MPTIENNHLQQPYPLQRRFLLWVLPGLVLCILALIFATGLSARKIITDGYLHAAHRQANAIVTALQRSSPNMWRQFTDGTVRQPTDWVTGEWATFAALIDQMAADKALPKLKIYDQRGVVLYSSIRLEIGDVERGEAITSTLLEQRGNALLVGTGVDAQYELYTYLEAQNSHPILVIELYEPATWLGSLISLNVMSLLVLPIIVLGLVLVVLLKLVRSAQTEINSRTAIATDLQTRLEKLISRRAASAAVQSQSGLNDGHTIDATLYFADVRRFTSFAENHTPQQVVSLLNGLIDIQVKVIHHFGGDVDKLIGDAVLAVFTGPDRSARAVASGQEILSVCANIQNLDRTLGIAVYDGLVIAGSIGSAERQDYTVIGDAVNVAARLCALALEGELVTDVATLARAGHPDQFSQAEEVELKGRTDSVRIRRWKFKHPN